MKAILLITTFMTLTQANAASNVGQGVKLETQGHQVRLYRACLDEYFAGRDPRAQHNESLAQDRCGLLRPDSLGPVQASYTSAQEMSLRAYFECVKRQEQTVPVTSAFA